MRSTVSPIALRQFVIDDAGECGGNCLAAMGTDNIGAGGRSQSSAAVAPAVLRQVAADLAALADRGVPVEVSRLQKIMAVLPRPPPDGIMWVRPRRACQITGLGLTKLYELINDGRVESRRLDGARLISVDSLRRLGPPA
jgi:hypothetical protein